MCVIERRTYLAGTQRHISETLRLCEHAVGSWACSNTMMRELEEADVVERRPGSQRPDMDDIFTTEGFNGRRNTYREIGRRSSKRSSGVRYAINQTSPMSTGASPSAASFALLEERRPYAPSPPPAMRRDRQDSDVRRPVSADEETFRSIAPNETAIYERGPAFDSRRHSATPMRTRFAVTGDEDERLGPARESAAPYRGSLPRPILRTAGYADSTAASPLSSSPTPSSPGLSQLPKFTHFRQDSARDLPAVPSREGSAEARRRLQQRDEDRQASIERVGMAASEQRQEARREASRARHRAEAAAALEGQRRQIANTESAMAARLDDEFSQMSRERGDAETRRRDPERSGRPESGRLQADAEAQWRYQQTGVIVGASSSDPDPSATPFIARRVTTRPIVHQEDISQRRRDSLRERGEALIAREQLRAELAPRGRREAARSSRVQRASRRLSVALDELQVEGDEDVNVEYDLTDEEVRERLGSRTERRWRRDREREERKREFWR